MQFISVKCCVCEKEVFRTRQRINESKRFGWKAYCSLSCQGKSKSKQKYVVCSLPGCNNKVFKKMIGLKKTVRSFCSHSCAAKFYNQKRIKKTKTCANLNCSNIFYGSNKYCSAECIPKPESKYSTMVILEEIRNFESERGRIPTKKDLMRIYRVTRKLFGTWNNAIKAAGFEPNPVKVYSKRWAQMRLVDRNDY